jgi:hypothetical protein
MQKLKVAAASLNGLLRKPDRNLNRIEQWSVKAKEGGAHVVLFPRTGHSPDLLANATEYGRPPPGIAASAPKKSIGTPNTPIAPVTTREGYRQCYEHCHQKAPVNPLGSWVGIMSPSNGDQGVELAPTKGGERNTGERHGRRVALIDIGSGRVTT